MKLKSLAVLGAVMLASGARAGAAGLTPAPPVPSALEVAISAPINNLGNRDLFFTAHPFIDVVIRNASKQSVKFWVNAPLTLEVVAIDGKALPVPLVVSSAPPRDRHWEELAPGDMFVRRLSLHKYKPGEERAAKPGVNYGQEYVGFPSFMNYHDSLGAVHSVRVRVVIDSSGLEGNTGKPLWKGFWSGRAVSEAREYQVFDIDYEQWKQPPPPSPSSH